eukprot:GHVL01020585.1.p1 GENE.GHVL01020585.1~~GHVL01020585.1.p1  ORF type:complete len:133 (-),score=10.72 GHVL01020585.1:46-444(-)
MIYIFFIYYKQKCLYNKSWMKNPHVVDDKLLSGVLFSMKAFCNKIALSKTFRSFTTSQYKLQILETLSGYKFILFTDPNATDQTEILKKFYHRVFVDELLDNPAYYTGDTIENAMFNNSVEQYFEALPVFKS